MRRLGDLIARHVPEIARTETRDTGQVIAQTAKQLVPRSADNFHYFAEMCVRVDGHTYPTATHLNYTLFHPVGVCALISPWNVPFMTATWKVAPALAFGNTAVLKMSELSPLSAARLGELALEAGIPAGVLNVVHGYGAEAGEPLCRHPDVRAISFTGSTATGNRIVKAAGLKKFSMELGGKSPFVVFEDADLRARARCRAVHDFLQQRRALHGGLAHPGAEIDLPRVRAQVHRARAAHRGRRSARREDHHRPHDQRRIILEKVRRYIEIGSEGGRDSDVRRRWMRRSRRARSGEGNFVKATVFADVDNRMRIAQEEIFGPVACLIPFDGRGRRHRQGQRHRLWPAAATSGARISGGRIASPPPSRPACAS